MTSSKNRHEHPTILHMCTKGERRTLTGGVAAALTTNETFFEEVCSDLPPTVCLAASTDEVRDDDDTNARVAIFFLSVKLLMVGCYFH